MSQAHIVGTKVLHDECHLHLQLNMTEEECKKTAYQWQYCINFRDFVLNQPGYLEYLGITEDEWQLWLEKLLEHEPTLEMYQRWLKFESMKYQDFGARGVDTSP